MILCCILVMIKRTFDVWRATRATRRLKFISVTSPLKINQGFINLKIDQGFDVTSQIYKYVGQSISLTSPPENHGFFIAYLDQSGICEISTNKIHSEAGKYGRIKFVKLAWPVIVVENEVKVAVNIYLNERKGQ